MARSEQQKPQQEPIATASDGAPLLVLDNRAARRVAAGFPWVYASDLHRAQQRPKGLTPGCVVHFSGRGGRVLASGYANPHSTLLGRVLSVQGDVVAFDQAFFEKRIAAALALREQFFDAPYYRLIHAESDFLPGLVVDRFGDVLSCQINTAGIDALKETVVAALVAVTGAKTVFLRNDSPVREQEGLKLNVECMHGTLPDDGMADLVENGVKFQADLPGGQKTGWFFDQRNNRAFVAGLAKDKTMLDVFCYSGGFGVTAAAGGAKHVTFVDSSAEALELARNNARLNGVDAKCEFVRDKAYRLLEQMVEDGAQFDVVCIDPPAFIKNRKSIKSGLRGYGKLARLAAKLVAPGGWFFMASCSHHAAVGDLQDTIADGIARAGQKAQLVRTGSAAPDHPVCPLLPETGYLKSFTYHIADNV